MNVIINKYSMILDEDKLCILREVDNKKDISQRGLAKSLNFSLGKINYCLKALKKKGLIKIENFQKNTNKQAYFHILTPKGLVTKKNLTINFMKKKLKEYDDLKKGLSE